MAQYARTPQPVLLQQWLASYNLGTLIYLSVGMLVMGLIVGLAAGDTSVVLITFLLVVAPSLLVSGIFLLLTLLDHGDLVHICTDGLLYIRKGQVEAIRWQRIAEVYKFYKDVHYYQEGRISYTAKGARFPGMT